MHFWGHVIHFTAVWPNARWNRPLPEKLNKSSPDAYQRNMKTAILTLTITLFALQYAMAQISKEADPKDVGSLDSIMRAVYDVISGEQGKARDWDRFRSLLHKDARLIPSGKNVETGVVGVRTLTTDEYVKRAQPVFKKEGFHERETARHTDIYGNIAQVFSTYESRHSPKDPKPFARGINSFQLLNDGMRWWVVTIYWEAETAGNPIPKKYLKNRN
jgi:hypothetical protein